ncbi:MAG TPA: hypothetical protein VGQ87_00180 [Patescibacteria group bacterium]|jgi:hypothetical protein|nr:hypothetical protein [Patescibacteria group bacterium]
MTENQDTSKLELLQKAYDEAHDKLLTSGSDKDLDRFTLDHPDVGAVQQYFDDNNQNMTQDEKLFLQATIELRKAIGKK